MGRRITTSRTGHIATGVVMVGAVLAWGPHAHADFVELSPRSLAMGDSLRADAVGAMAITLNPAGVALGKSYTMEGDYGYRPDDHAQIFMGSVCDSVTAKIGACLSYDHLGSDYNFSQTGDRNRNEYGLTLGAPLGDSLALGLTLRYTDYTETPPPGVVDHDHGGLTLDVGMAYRLASTFNLGFVAYNLAGNDDFNYARAIGFGFSFNVATGLLIAGDGRYDFGTDSGHYGGGVEYTFSGADGQQGVPLRVGYVYDELARASYITGGIGIVSPRIGIDIGIRKQISGIGDELLFQAGLRFFFPNS